MKVSQKKIQGFDMFDFGAIRISLASPEQIKEWSYGEVKKTETLNHKTLKPERDGLFCEKIFGPVRDYECSCGKYKKSPTVVSASYKRIECDRCGVEITSSKVRRERMGHITLAVPVAHYWYFGKTPSKIAIFLDMSQEDVRKIVYGMLWVVVKDIDDIKDVVIKALDEVKVELKLSEETYLEIFNAVKSEKIPLPKKLVLDVKHLIEYFRDKKFKFVKVLEQGGKENIFSSLIKKIITVITDDEKYIGNLSDEKNYLRESVSVLTNAEALYRLLRMSNDELKKGLDEIRQKLQELSLSENITRVNALFEKYKDFNILLEDLQKIETIVKHLKQISKTNTIKEIEDSLKDPTSDKSKTLTSISKLRSELIKNIHRLPTEIMDVLFILFEKYNVTIQPSPLRSRLINRFKLIESFLTNNIKPEWMILQVLPVLPPDLRPLVAIEGGKFASSDLNELYRRIIHRNNRLRKFLSGQGEKGEKSGVPKLILLNEKRLLQEAVDALIENSAKKHPVMSSQNRPLKSLTDILKGKQGRFRQNLLGKRIDYSGRSVIVVGPELKLYQCGLPKEMALELFKPFLLHKLMKKYGVTLKKAKTILEVKRPPEIWDLLEEITKHHPILLNRAPTLHRPSIQAFEPVLIDEKAIRIHPMVCTPYNADFDGDQMAVYVPLTLEAITEAKLLMTSYFSLFSPANGKALIGPTQDVVLGVAYLTAEKVGVQGEGLVFASSDEAIYCYHQGLLDLNAKIKVLGINDLEIKEEAGKKDYSILENPSLWKDYTTVGRLIFNSILPYEISIFNPTLPPAEKKRRNCQLGKKELVDLIKECYNKCGWYKTVLFLDELKKLGYHYATVSGFTISVDDMKLPKHKQQVIEETWEKVKEIMRQSEEGVITEKERYNSIIDLWSEAIEKIVNEMTEEMKMVSLERYSPGSPRHNSVYFMAQSGARGNMDQVRQLSGIRGLMSRPQRKITGEIGEIIEIPVVSNFREGLSVLEYFISTHGGRKGLSDTALKTSEAGYLTRRLVDVAHHVVVTEEDCGTNKRIKVSALKIGDEVIESLAERIAGRVAADDITYEVLDETSGKIITKTIKAGDLITEEQAQEIEKTGIYDTIRIRSVLTCEAKNGVCAKCYGMDLSTGELVKVGEAVGIIAAQSIGEPGTQLTLRTFHIGGAAARLTKQSQIKAPYDGIVEFTVEPHEISSETKKFKTIQKKDEAGRTVHIVLTSDAVIKFEYTDAKGERRKEFWPISYGSRIYVEDGAEVKKGTLIADWDQYSIPIIAEKSGKIKYRDLEENKTYVVEYRTSGNVEKRVLPRKGKANPRLDIIGDKGKIIASYPLPADSVILVEDGENVEAGDVIAKIFKEEIKTKDITGGLPRIEELFEARHPSNPAVLSEIDGIVKIETSTVEVDDEHREMKIAIKVVNPKSKKEIKYEIPPGRIPLVYDGDKVEAGEPLTDGVIDPHKYLEIRGPQHLQEFLLNEIQQVYRLQGVNINDKHIEIIIRQMLSFVRITDPGLPPKPDPQKNKHFYEFIYGEIVPKRLFEEEVNKINEEIKELKKANQHSAAMAIRPPKAEPVLLGITTVASSSESFLSAASFQETSRVLTESALECKVDELVGLKENVILGRLIPAGTGIYAEEAISLTKEVKPVEELLKL